MRRKAVLFSAVVLSVSVLGCSDDEKPEAEEQLYGTWNVVAAGSHHTWEPGGTWYVTAAAGGAPYDFGTYTFDGSTVTLKGDPDEGECPQTTGVYEVTFIDADTISLELVEDDCYSRSVFVPRAPWDRVETE